MLLFLLFLDEPAHAWTSVKLDAVHVLCALRHVWTGLLLGSR